MIQTKLEIQLKDYYDKELFNCLVYSWNGNEKCEAEKSVDWMAGESLIGDFENPQRIQFYSFLVQKYLEVLKQSGKGSFYSLLENGEVKGGIATLEISQNDDFSFMESVDEFMLKNDFYTQNKQIFDPLIEERYNYYINLMSSEVKKIVKDHKYIYLYIAGVSTDSQGKGYCSKLFKQVNLKQDEMKINCYLEAVSFKLSQIYQRYGFQVIKQVDLEYPGSETIPIYIMKREFQILD